ncbi:zf-HC2 domain-containing protein [Maribellus sp. CM-23]|uniref:zf-HC2 domain-containing protein n=1 Tax=Maribellus sp. CM-23 TaxID=2781026 RepID=UPI001F44F611|nr:zf-HC2 domain-containing protein [Maribellus sp. CM-23]MCE4563759.1 zf-HC2 domain-containing protein [Maribellus sp. CM-23]
MKCEEVKLNIPELIDGKLDAVTVAKMELHLKSCASCREVFNDLNSFLKFTDSLPEIEPPSGMKEEFMMMFNEQTSSQKGRMIILPSWIKVAAVVVLALGTFAAGYFSGSGNGQNVQLAAEVQSLKQQVVLAGLKDYSGPQKIEAVYSAAEYSNKNADLVDALMYTLNSDKNINVRLAALNVLSGMVSDNQEVKSGLVQSLLVQDNPLVQISLIQVLTESGVNEAKDNIEFIKNQAGTDPNVKDFAQDMMKTII